MNKRFTIWTAVILAFIISIAGAKAISALPGDPVIGDDRSECLTADGPIEAAECYEWDYPPLEIRAARSRLPNPLPDLLFTPVEIPQQDGIQYVYAKVLDPDVGVYNHPAEAEVGMPPARTLGTGFIYVSIDGYVEYNGQEWAQINPNEYVTAEHLWIVSPSRFRGVELAGQPGSPFAWIVQPIQPSISPGGPRNTAVPAYQRYQMVSIYNQAITDDGWKWYQVGDDQWVMEPNLGVVTVDPPPPGVGGRWIEIDLYEQTMAMYEGGSMVYATLISSGLGGAWATREGLFQIHHMVEDTKMSGSAGFEDYYYLENVPWNMYFDENRAMHGAYWHDSFGFRHSHGCVNMSPADAQWLYNWASLGTWVWVHSSGQYRE